MIVQAGWASLKSIEQVVGKERLEVSRRCWHCSPWVEFFFLLGNLNSPLEAFQLIELDSTLIMEGNPLDLKSTGVKTNDIYKTPSQLQQGSGPLPPWHPGLMTDSSPKLLWESFLKTGRCSVPHRTDLEQWTHKQTRVLLFKEVIPRVLSFCVDIN